MKNKEFRAGSISSKIAEGLRAGKNFEQLKKELNLSNTVTFYKVRKDIGMGAGSKVSLKARAAKRTASARRPAIGSRDIAGIVRIEAIFHGVEGERYRVLAPPKDFLAIYETIAGASR